MITTVIFDLDDTLYDELEYCRSGFEAVAQFLSKIPHKSPLKPSYGELFSALWTEFESGNHKKTFNSALDKLKIGYDTETIRHLVDIYRTHKPRIQLPEETKHILDLLHRKYTLALLSDGYLPAQQLKVEALGIERYFSQIVYTEKLGRQYWKPSEKPYKLILRQSGQKGENCVYVADNPEKDFIAANRLRIHTIQIVRPHCLHRTAPQQPEAAAGQIIASLAQLPRALEHLEKSSRKVPKQAKTSR